MTPLRTPEALAVIGPKGFGFDDLEYAESVS